MFRLSLSALMCMLFGLAVFAQAPQSGGKKKDPFDTPPSGADREMVSLAKQLKSPGVKGRLDAIQAIAAKGEEAASIAGPLCDAILDSSPKVATVAVQAVEKVRPDLYKPLTALMVDRDNHNRLKGAKELGLMGEKAAPTVNVLVSVLRKELAGGPGNGGRLTEMQTELFNAIRQINPDDAATVKIYKAIAAPANQHAAARAEGLAFLNRWAGSDLIRRKEILPLVRAGLSEEKHCQIPCIHYVGEYGTLAKDCIPQLKQLKLSSSAAVREAATASLDKIENQ
jgi:hypothetical protein